MVKKDKEYNVALLYYSLKTPPETLCLCGGRLQSDCAFQGCDQTVVAIVFYCSSKAPAFLLDALLHR